MGGIFGVTSKSSCTLDLFWNRLPFSFRYKTRGDGRMALRVFIVQSITLKTHPSVQNLTET